MRHWHKHARRAITILGAFALLVSLSACDGCQEKKTDPPKETTTTPPVQKDMGKPAPDLPEEDPLEEAREKADKDGVDVAIGRQDTANLAAANIEAALKSNSGKTKTRIKTSSKATGKIDPKDAAKVFRKFEGAMKMCYERALKKSPGLEGKVNLTVVVASSGKVSSANARGISLKSSQVSNCMETLAKRMKFPEPKGGDARVSKAYIFKPAL